MLAFDLGRHRCSNASIYSLTRESITVYMIDGEHLVELVVLMLQSGL